VVHTSRPRSSPRTGRHERRRRHAAYAASAVVILAGGGGAIAVAAGGGGSGHAPAPAVASAGEHHRFRGAHHAPFISLSTYKALWNRRASNVVLVDVRGAADRAKAHIPHDIWVPLADARSTGWRFLERYRRKLIVLYCDCPWAEAAQESAILEAHGFSDRHLRVLHPGIPGWIRAGYPVVAGGDVCARHHWPRACKRG